MQNPSNIRPISISANIYGNGVTSQSPDGLSSIYGYEGKCTTRKPVGLESDASQMASGGSPRRKPPVNPKPEALHGKVLFPGGELHPVGSDSQIDT